METRRYPEFGGGGKLASRRRDWPDRPLPGLKLDRCQHTERRVPALTIVEDLEVLEQRVGELQSRSPGPPVQELDLDAAPECLHQGVVEAGAHRPHRGHQARVLSAARECPRAERGALVAHPPPTLQRTPCRLAS